jgi:CheY-like chemotaxis protein
MHNYHILVAEDDADDRYLLQTAFSENGNKEPVKFVNDGVELMAYLDKVHTELPTAESSFPCFIMLDLNMPKKDGKEVLKIIKEHPTYKKIPVIIFTTTKNDQEIKRCYELGANTYVVKPVSFDVLMSVLEGIRSYWFTIATISA